MGGVPAAWPSSGESPPRSLAEVARRRAATPDAWIAALQPSRTAGTGSTRRSAGSRRSSPSSTTNPPSGRSASSGAPTRTPARRWPTGSSRALAKAGWSVPGDLHQTQVYAEVVAAAAEAGRLLPRRRDALRDGRRARRAAAGVRRGRRIRPAVGGAAVDHAGRHGGAACRAPRPASTSSPRAASSASRIDGTFLPDLTAAASSPRRAIPALVDLTLGERARAWPQTKLAAQARAAPRSSSSAPRRSTPPAKAASLPGAPGHGHRHRRPRPGRPEARGAPASSTPSSRPTTATSSRTATATSPCGSTRPAATPSSSTGAAGSVAAGRRRRAASACRRPTLGYASDLDFVFPPGTGVFKAGGDLGYHHGGPTLQELVVPVVTVRIGRAGGRGRSRSRLTVTGRARRDHEPDLQRHVVSSAARTWRCSRRRRSCSPMLHGGGQQVGTAGMAIGAELDRATGTVTLQPGKPVTVGFLLDRRQRRRRCASSSSIPRPTPSSTARRTTSRSTSELPDR